MNDPKTPYSVVIDFEATCGDGIAGNAMEIIEFAAIVADSSWNPLDNGEFCRFTRPVLHPLLSSFCKELTTIPQNEVDWSPVFPEVLTEFVGWLGRLVPLEDVTFCSWGDFDKKQLQRECERWNVPYPFSKNHVNLRPLAVKRLGISKGQKQGLFSVVEFLGLPFLGTQHRGIDDCRNAIQVFQKIRATSDLTKDLVPTAEADF
jgi:inhibitor of KinA sporulation pathway (predicted exonuclease)